MMTTKNNEGKMETNTVKDVTPKEKKRLNKKQKIAVVVCSVVLVIVLVVGGWYLFEKNAKMM